MNSKQGRTLKKHIKKTLGIWGSRYESSPLREERGETDI